MSKIHKVLRYTEEHEWVREEAAEGVVSVGITADQDILALVQLLIP